MVATSYDYETPSHVKLMKIDGTTSKSVGWRYIMHTSTSVQEMGPNMCFGGHSNMHCTVPPPVGSSLCDSGGFYFIIICMYLCVCAFVFG